MNTQDMDYDQYARYVRTEAGHSIEEARACAYVTRLQAEKTMIEDRCCDLSDALVQAMSTMSTHTLKGYLAKSGECVFHLVNICVRTKATSSKRS